jgi:hypothetical protein
MVPSEDGAVFDTAGVGTWKLFEVEGTESASLTQDRGYKTKKVLTMEEESLFH